MMLTVGPIISVSPDRISWEGNVALIFPYADKKYLSHITPFMINYF